MKRITAILLTGLLLLSTIGCIRVSCNGLSLSAPIRYANADKYTAGNFTYDETKVKKVEIEWISGSVTLSNGSGTLSVSESGADTLPAEKQLHWWIDGTTLKIKFCKSGENLSLTELEDKKLTVELPASADLKLDIASGTVLAKDALKLGECSINSASGGMNFASVSAEEIGIECASGSVGFGTVSAAGSIEIESASGELDIGDVTAEEISVKNASGSIRIDSVTANELKIESASGGIDIGLKYVADTEIDVASGNIRLNVLDKEAGAVFYLDHYHVFSSSVTIDMKNKPWTLGRGEQKVTIDAASGNIKVD